MGADNFAPEGGEGKGRRGANYEGGDGFLTRPAGQGGPADVRARYENWSTSVRAVASIDADTDIQARARVYRDDRTLRRSEEHTSELQSLMRISYAVFCLKKKNHTKQ